VQRKQKKEKEKGKRKRKKRKSLLEKQTVFALKRAVARSKH
jgi:hypothetical protein